MANNDTPTKKRKPPIRKDLEKRAAQNKAAQVAYRTRKQNHISDLEQKVSELTAALLASRSSPSSACVSTQTETQVLRERITQLESENATLQKMHLSSDVKLACIETETGDNDDSPEQSEN
ncbi:hypothetical protein BDR26DRAFT_891696 [Obelidium mucronatum]|nr:hypothetical protein BDR26DRAFT_891696 [Obelidium mucronatum]